MKWNNPLFSAFRVVFNEGYFEVRDESMMKALQRGRSASPKAARAWPRPE